MREFGWTIEYTLSLPFPVFIDLFGLIRKVRADAAYDGVYLPYAAAKYGGKASKRLFESRGSVYIGEASKSPSVTVSRRQINQATKRFQAIIDAKNQALAEVVKG